MQKEIPTPQIAKHLQNYADIDLTDHTMKADHIKMAVGAGLGGLFGVTLNEWIGIATLLYFILQIGLLVPKYVKMFKSWRRRASNDG